MNARVFESATQIEAIAGAPARAPMHQLLRSAQNLTRGGVRSALAILLALTIVFAPMQAAFAQQTLDLPQAFDPTPAASASPADSTVTPDGQADNSTVAAPAVADPAAANTIPADVGSIDQYMNQQGEPARQQSFAGNSPSRDPATGSPATNAIVMGGLLVGLLVLDLALAHRHR